MKIKFGQNLGKNVILKIIYFLKIRNEPIDQITIREILNRSSEK
jgi:hypothetical protein